MYDPSSGPCTCEAEHERDVVAAKIEARSRAQVLAIRLAECSNRIRFKYRDTELAERVLSLANEVWDLGETG